MMIDQPTSKPFHSQPHGKTSDRERLSDPTSSPAACPICGATNLEEILTLRGLPVMANVLWDHREEALRAPRGDVALVFCPVCGHGFNQAYDPAALNYDVQYENSLHFSPVFQNYAAWLARRLVEHHDLRGKTIIEIGSGKGEFLRMLCDLGGNVGTGFDPSYEPAPDERKGSISFIRDLYSERYAHYQADLIISRHVLEHIYRPSEFIGSLRRTIGDHKRTVVFFEVPNWQYILRDTAIWDIIYEHFSYFSPHSLAGLFMRSGFNILNLAEGYDGQFLLIEALPRDIHRQAPNGANAQPLSELCSAVRAFSTASRQKLEEWRRRMNALHAAGKRVALWGAGSKGISFLNMLDLADTVDIIVDINPRKKGKFVTGAGQEIVPPEALKAYRPDTIIIMNPIYRHEIEKTTQSMGLSVDFLYAS
jgi:hypothetical protein